MNTYVLDTHAALWWWRDSPLLSVAARDAIADGGSCLLVSAVSALEVAIKFRIGKLHDIGDPAVHFPRLMQMHGFESVAISEAQAMRAGLLSGEHRDPFDRLIAALAIMKDATVITRDPAFDGFGCKVLW